MLVILVSGEFLPPSKGSPSYFQFSIRSVMVEKKERDEEEKKKQSEERERQGQIRKRPASLSHLIRTPITLDWALPSDRDRLLRVSVYSSVPLVNETSVY